MDDAKTVWCGNLPDQVTEELLYELFLQSGPLERVKIPTDREVNYAAQLLNGIRLYDKNLSVKPRNANSQQGNNGNINTRSRPHENMPPQSPQIQMYNQNPFMGNLTYDDLMRMGQMMHIPNNFNRNYNEPRHQQNYQDNRQPHHHHQQQQRHWGEQRINTYQEREQRDQRSHRQDFDNRKHDSPNRNNRRNDRSNYGNRSRRNHY